MQYEKGIFSNNAIMNNTIIIGKSITTQALTAMTQQKAILCTKPGEMR